MEESRRGTSPRDRRGSQRPVNRFILDTDHLSLFFHGNAVVSNNIFQHPPASIAVSVITIDETLSGWYALLRRVKNPGDLPRAYGNLAESMAFLCPLVRLPFDERAADV